MSGDENPLGAAFQVENADGDARVLLICVPCQQCAAGCL